jgi:hypothetical protein
MHILKNLHQNDALLVISKSLVCPYEFSYDHFLRKSTMCHVRQHCLMFTDKADGWYIGGRARNGRWYWEDGSYMRFKNFASDSILFPQTGTTRTVYNYAYVPSFGRKWKYASRRSSNKLGVICEQKC